MIENRKDLMLFVTIAAIGTALLAVAGIVIADELLRQTEADRDFYADMCEELENCIQQAARERLRERTLDMNSPLRRRKTPAGDIRDNGQDRDAAPL